MKHANKVNMSFRYIPAASTDIAKTIARKKRELAEQKEREAAALAEAQVKVTKIKREAK